VGTVRIINIILLLNYDDSLPTMETLVSDMKRLDM